LKQQVLNILPTKSDGSNVLFADLFEDYTVGDNLKSTSKYQIWRTIGSFTATNDAAGHGSYEGSMFG